MTKIYFLGLSLLALACRAGTTELATCESDAECTLPGTRCDLERKACVCATDEACEDGFFCNRAGVCQVIAGCTRNDDCQGATFCDLDSGRCLIGDGSALGGNCGLASHCPLGSVCKSGACEAGCFDDGDCVLGQVCLAGLCSTGTNLCSSDAFCDYGERCSGNQCTDDNRGPYCRGCTQRTAQNPEPCDAPRNFCLINNRELGGFTQFCGVDCSLGQPCPNGYGCSRVVILTQQTCFSTAECQCSGPVSYATATCSVAEPCSPTRPDGTPDPMATACVNSGHPDCNAGGTADAACIVSRGQVTGSCTCSTNDHCGEGQVCTSGLCCGGTVREERECRGGEGTISGFCSCATDDDCPRDTCDGSRGACAITGNPCTPGGNDCGPIPCVGGGCLIGNNCAPEAGLACSDVTGG